MSGRFGSFSLIQMAALVCLCTGIAHAIELTEATPEQREKFKGKASIEGRLTWSGGAPAAAETFDVVAYTPEVSDLIIGEIKTDADGHYRVEGLLGKPARYRLFLKSDVTQRTFYIYVPDDEAKIQYSYSFQPRVGDPAPPHVMPDMDGKPVDLASFKGKIVVLKFWAVWCGPCHAQMEELNKLIADHPDWKEKVIFLAINADPKKMTLAKFIEEKKLAGMIHLFEEGKRLEGMRSRGFHIDSLPFTFVLDRAGVVRHRSEQSENLAGILETLLKE